MVHSSIPPLPHRLPSVMGTSTTVRQRTKNSTENKGVIKITSEGERRDKELDKHDTYV